MVCYAESNYVEDNVDVKKVLEILKLICVLQIHVSCCQDLERGKWIQQIEFICLGFFNSETAFGQQSCNNPVVQTFLLYIHLMKTFNEGEAYFCNTRYCRGF